VWQLAHLAHRGSPGDSITSSLPAQRSGSPEATAIVGGEAGEASLSARDGSPEAIISAEWVGLPEASLQRRYRQPFAACSLVGKAREAEGFSWRTGGVAGKSCWPEHLTGGLGD